MLNLPKNNEIKIWYLIHFWELALKWKNRKNFENKLINSLENKIWKKINYIYEYWKLIITDNNDKIKNAISHTFWIANRAKCYIIPFKEEKLTNELIQIIINLIDKDLNLKNITYFKIETKRSNKKFIPNSIEINKTLASKLINLYNNLKINLSNPEKTIFIEIWNKNIYLYFEKNNWLWWLPTGTSWKIISLLSGWIDSPVASWLLMKRWAEIIFLHWYTKKLDSNNTNKNKILQLVNILAKYQWKAKIYFIDVSHITRQIVENIPPKRRMLIFKRSLVKLWNEIAKKENALAICSWDSLAQVASQTLENINVIFSASEKPILTPLIWFDKLEIIQLSKKIGTYEISIQPSTDRCSKISHKHPITKWKIEIAKKLEEKINIYPLDYEIITIEHPTDIDAIEK